MTYQRSIDKFPINEERCASDEKGRGAIESIMTLASDETH